MTTDDFADFSVDITKLRLTDARRRTNEALSLSERQKLCSKDQTATNIILNTILLAYQINCSGFTSKLLNLNVLVSAYSRVHGLSIWCCKLISRGSGQ